MLDAMMMKQAFENVLIVSVFLGLFIVILAFLVIGLALYDKKKWKQSEITAEE